MRSCCGKVGAKHIAKLGGQTKINTNAPGRLKIKQIFRNKCVSCGVLRDSKSTYNTVVFEEKQENNFMARMSEADWGMKSKYMMRKITIKKYKTKNFALSTMHWDATTNIAVTNCGCKNLWKSSGETSPSIKYLHDGRFMRQACANTTADGMGEFTFIQYVHGGKEFTTEFDTMQMWGNNSAKQCMDKVIKLNPRITWRHCPHRTLRGRQSYRGGQDTARSTVVATRQRLVP